MNKHFLNIIKKSTNSKSIHEIEEIQSLWSGYGQIVRYGLEGSKFNSIVIKHVQYPNTKKHPRGWNTDISHQRKLKSYQVETAWYDHYSNKCDNSCKVPKIFAIESQGDEVLMVMEDLDSSGYSIRKTSVNWEDIKSCLAWLANFHAIFMNQSPDKLWKNGTYWHLDTRPDELKVLDDSNLKKYAGVIDLKLKQANYKTFVHGDAKLANFCFSNENNNVAAVDFQYIGGGCGMKDIAYFIGSCLHEDECESYEQEILDFYFSSLKTALEKHNNSIDFKSVENEWRELYPFAWTDFHRFLKGWSPGHWKINTYSERLACEVIKKLQNENTAKI